MDREEPGVVGHRASEVCHGGGGRGFESQPKGKWRLQGAGGMDRETDRGMKKDGESNGILILSSRP